MPKPNDVGVGVAVALLNLEGQVLMLKRQGAHVSGKWAFPGGWIDRNDKTLFDVVQREAAEEVGVTVTKTFQVGATTEDHPDFRSVTLYFICYPSGWEGVPQILEPNKCSELRWCDPLNLPENVFPGLTEGVIFVNDHIERTRNSLI